MRNIDHHWLIAGWHYTKQDDEPGSQRWRCQHCDLEIIARVRPSAMICPALSPQPTFPRMQLPPDLVEEEVASGC